MTDFRPRVRGGFVASGFEAVGAEFERNFEERGELGAAFTVLQDGVPVVDLWGGIADRATGRPWETNSLIVLFSGTKGVVSACILMLIERGLLDLEAPVARYWPEFSQAGKSEVLVRDVMGHTTGLPGLAEPVTWQEATDDRRMAALLAAQAPSEDSRAMSAYNAITFGWLCGELIRRVDGRSVGQFVAEEIRRPLGLELWIGLPGSEQGRVVSIEPAPNWANDLPKDPLARSVFANPVRFAPGCLPANEPAWRAAEVPASNGVGTVRSVARFYANLERLMQPQTIALGVSALSVRTDQLRDCPVAFAVGFGLQTAMREFGPPDDAFGANGAGGSRYGYWPSQRLAFAYGPNRLGDPEDERGAALLSTLYACADASRSQ